MQTETKTRANEESRLVEQTLRIIPTRHDNEEAEEEEDEEDDDDDDENSRQGMINSVLVS